MQAKTLFGYISLSGVFLFLDRVLKWIAVTAIDREFLLSKNFGWDPFLNEGIAFGIRVPQLIVVLLTLIIIGAVLYFYYLNEKAAQNKGDKKILLGLALILSGALSNLFDRLAYDYTIDYIRVFTGVINLADIFIVLGFVLYFSSLNQEAPKP